ncbi:ATP synthase f chain, mitochondrial precursor [Coemansia biformis]|uniref:ATP synthase f chain, mitochondrial n=1 Tax=Coemansia biformis TaxID=1286918 RepID=A0A9W7Y9B0_9FUNG|nr:ATP synthase f chain, mitochondrial precursor [Coemansia biformis]
MNAAFGRTILGRAAAARRTYASLREIIPPNIGHAARAGEAVADSTVNVLSAEQVGKVVSLYRNLPKGQAEPKVARGGPLARYYARYFEGDNASPKPIVHLVGALLVGGYTIHYFMHLKHHKHAEHH